MNGRNWLQKGTAFARDDVCTQRPHNPPVLWIRHLSPRKWQSLSRLCSSYVVGLGWLQSLCFNIFYTISSIPFVLAFFHLVYLGNLSTSVHSWVSLTATSSVLWLYCNSWAGPLLMGTIKDGLFPIFGHNHCTEWTPWPLCLVHGLEFIG